MIPIVLPNIPLVSEGMTDMSPLPVFPVYLVFPWYGASVFGRSYVSSLCSLASFVGMMPWRTRFDEEPEPRP